MVKVIKEEPLSNDRIRCNSCGMLLEYEKDDMRVTPDNLWSGAPLMTYTWFIICPSCGKRVIV